MKIGEDSVVKNNRYPNSRTTRIITMVTIAVVIAVAALLQFPFATTPPAEAQLGSPPFENPPELASDPAKKRLRATMEIINGTFTVPGLKTEQYRQFRGRYPGSPIVPGDAVGPGPTLRARLGDQVQLAFLNKVDENQFPYTYVTGKDKPPFSDAGCDQAGLPDPKTGKYPYPANDIYPNCFHGSNTANIHFHGTHTSPDGLGDNVLVQVLPEPRQRDWTSIFNKIYDSGSIPQKWEDLPLEFRKAQIALVKKRDEVDMARAIKNGLRLPESMSKANHEQIAAGEWPQYFIGAFPNFFDIPDYDSGKGIYKAGQSPGTHWYHAHKHGSTSLHIRNGLAGAFVIESSQEGGYDHFIRKSFGWGATYGDHEKIFVFQQFDPTQNLERNKGGTKSSKQVVVNGELTPTISMKPGEVQLWRLVNATEGNDEGIINAGTSPGVFGAPTFKIVQTAQDGVQFSPANYVGQPYLSGAAGAAGLVLAGGNRADLLVKAPLKPGTVPFISDGVTLFFVKVEGSAVTPDTPFPTTWADMPPFLLDLPVPGPNDIKNPNSPVQFQWEPGRTGPGKKPYPPHFMINDKQFGESGPVVDQCMPLDGLQDWVLENYTTAIAHPFHIHINPFQVIRIDTPTPTAPNKYSSYTPTGNYLWQDVIAVPPAIINKDGSITPGKIVIRQTYLDFTGTYVLHCHILAHEDRGMMQLVRVVPLANYPKGCQDTPPQHH